MKHDLIMYYGINPTPKKNKFFVGERTKYSIPNHGIVIVGCKTIGTAGCLIVNSEIISGTPTNEISWGASLCLDEPFSKNDGVEHAFRMAHENSFVTPDMEYFSAKDHANALAKLVWQTHSTNNIFQKIFKKGSSSLLDRTDNRSKL